MVVAMRHPMVTAISFVDRINHGDATGLADLMAPDYVLQVFDEPPQPGHESGVAGWRGYAASFPGYVIHPRRLAVQGHRVAILGHTTGSHPGLPDEEEEQLTLIWLADIAGDRVQRWTLVEDTPEARLEYGLD